MKSTANITIDVYVDYSWLTPSFESLLEPSLTFRSSRVVPGGSFEFQRVQKKWKLFSTNGKRLSVRTTLLSRVISELRAAGYEPNIVDRRRDGPQLHQDENYRQSLAEHDRPFANAVQAQMRGVAEAASMADIAHKTAVICRLFPKARIIIATAARRLCRHLHRHLHGLLDGNVSTFENYTWPFEGGRLLCTLAEIARTNPDQTDLVILGDALQAIVPGKAKVLSKHRLQRMYAMTPPGSSSRRCGSPARRGWP